MVLTVDVSKILECYKGLVTRNNYIAHVTK
jgi:hypothetical protein